MAPRAQLDGSAVEKIDSAGIRLLLQFFRERRAAGTTVSWRSVSAVLRDALASVELAVAVNLPAARRAIAGRRAGLDRSEGIPER